MSQLPPAPENPLFKPVGSKLAVSALLVGIAIAGLYIANKSASGPGSSAVAHPNQDRRPGSLPVFNAIALSSEYNANEVKADQCYKNKLMAVRGVVEKVGKTPFGDMPYVDLKGDGLFGVSCEFADSDQNQIVNLVPGQMVTIAGTCDGKFGGVNLKKCWVYTPQ